MAETLLDSGPVLPGLDVPTFAPRKGVLLREYHVLVRWADGRRVAQQSVDLPAAAETTVTMSYRFDLAGADRPSLFTIGAAYHFRIFPKPR